MGKTLVAFFSASGVTARVAREVADATGADLFEIAPAEPYTAADLNWNNKQSRSSREMADESCRPEIAGALPELSGYDAVFIGFPIWWYVEPRIVDTFLDATDLAGKAVVPFATSGGSGIGGAEKRMGSLRPDAVWKAGKLLNGGSIAAWAQGALA